MIKFMQGYPENLWGPGQRVKVWPHIYNVLILFYVHDWSCPSLNIPYAHSLSRRGMGACAPPPPPPPPTEIL